MVCYDQSKYCERGLEMLWPKWKAARDNRRRNCFDAVISAQDKQQLQGYQCDKTQVYISIFSVYVSRNGIK